MSIDPHRLLGFAFAGADLLLEIDPGGQITFAIGATQAVLGPARGDLTGLDWRTLVHADDQPLVEAMFLLVEDGVRRGFAPVRLADGDRAVTLHARALPANGGRISCGLSPTPVPRVPATVGGLHQRSDFEVLARELTEAARATGVELELAMIELGGLAEAGPAAAARAAGALRMEAEGGVAAARLSDERFAVLRRPGDDDKAMARRLGRAVAQAGGTGVQARAQTVSTSAMSPSRLARALKLALDDFGAEGLKEDAPLNLAEAMNRSVRRALNQAGALGLAVSQRRFSLAFQPVVRLKDASLHHHEVLVRFENGQSPFDLVRMAEEFDLIEELDRAVVETTVNRLKADRTGAERLAVNVSGRTITSPTFISGVEAMMLKDQRLKGRLLFEITESAGIDDLVIADRHIQRLRDLGSLVCLDDFGAGAASLGYLQKLSVDIVKIDGRYVRDLVAGGRDATLVAHVVNLCRELGIRTVAEMVETPEVEAAVRAAGVDFGQGWLYGRPAEWPEAPLARPSNATQPMPARRAGSKEQWR